MARLRDRAEVYSAAAAFAERALLQDRSLFAPELRIWKADTVDGFQRQFDGHEREWVGRKDERKPPPVPVPSYVQMAAELLYVNLLPYEDIHGDTKRRMVGQLLSWSPTPAEIPPELMPALDQGIANGGAAKVFRTFQIAWLVEFVRHWKQKSRSDREAALRDPWAWKAALMAVPAPKATMQVESLLHLVHPDVFEPVIARGPKRQIVKAFGGRVSRADGDLDRALLTIRRELTPEFGEGFSFYDPRVAAKWRPIAEAELEPAELVDATEIAPPGAKPAPPPEDLEHVTLEISRRRNAIERRLREVIRDGLRFQYGRKAPGRLQSALQESRRELLARYGYRQVWEQLYFKELTDVLRREWAAFANWFEADKDRVTDWLDEVNRARADAHARVLEPDELAWLRVCFKRLEDELELLK